MTFGEVLRQFKSSEQPEDVVSLVDSADMRNGIIAWKSMIIKYKDSDYCLVTSESEMWEWMWSKVQFDIHKFGVVSGVKQQDAQNLFTRLCGCRLIYPDGTINNYAAHYLQAVIMSKLPKVSKSK